MYEYIPGCISIGNAADTAGVSRKTIYRFLNENKKQQPFRGYMLQADFDEFMRSRGHSSAESSGTTKEIDVNEFDLSGFLPDWHEYSDEVKRIWIVGYKMAIEGNRQQLKIFQQLTVPEILLKLDKKKHFTPDDYVKMMRKYYIDDDSNGGRLGRN